MKGIGHTVLIDTESQSQPARPRPTATRLQGNLCPPGVLALLRSNLPADHKIEIGPRYGSEGEPDEKKKKNLGIFVDGAGGTVKDGAMVESIRAPESGRTRGQEPRIFRRRGGVGVIGGEMKLGPQAVRILTKVASTVK